MTSQHTLVINGKVYDAISGLPVAMPNDNSKTQQAAPKKIHKTTKTTAVHSINHLRRTAQKSSTLRRDVVKKPTYSHTQTSSDKHKVPVTPKSPMIRKFAPHPQPLHEKKSVPTRSRKPDSHEMEAAVVRHTYQKLLSEHAVRSNKLIAERLSTVKEQAPQRKIHKKLRHAFRGRPRVASVVAVSLAVMIFGGYLTYLSMPSLSVRVAASQAGVAASFPDYHPDGYRFDGPVAYAPGQVAITFRANSSNSKYTVTQQKSSWDSQAVYDNLVTRVAGDNYITNSQSGLTIYTFGNKAAWVNKGMLYTVNGTATLSNEQLLRIAGSM